MFNKDCLVDYQMPKINTKKIRDILAHVRRPLPERAIVRC